MENNYLDYLKHSGVINMAWGVHNGPPYPLSREISDGKEILNAEGKSVEELRKLAAKRKQDRLNEKKKTLTKKIAIAEQKSQLNDIKRKEADAKREHKATVKAIRTAEKDAKEMRKEEKREAQAEANRKANEALDKQKQQQQNQQNQQQNNQQQNKPEEKKDYTVRKEDVIANHSTMTDNELNDALNRLNLQKRVAKLSEEPSKLDKAREVANKIANGVGVVTTVNNAVNQLTGVNLLNMAQNKAKSTIKEKFGKNDSKQASAKNQNNKQNDYESIMKELKGFEKTLDEIQKKK